MKFIELNTENEINSLLVDLPNVIALDCETTGLDWKKDNVTCVSIATSPTTAYYIPATFLPCLDKIKNTIIVLHNCKFDLKFLSKYGINLEQNNYIKDTVILHHLIDENSSHSLDFLVQAIFKDNYKELFWSKYKSIEEAPKQDVLEYVCKDTIYTLRLYKLLSTKLKGKENLVEHVHKLALALYETERDGVNIDLKRIQDKGSALSAEISDLKLRMREMTNVECLHWEYREWGKELNKRKTHKGKTGVVKPIFNFESNSQLSTLLYDLLGLPIQYNQKTRKQTVDATALAAIEDKHPVVPLIRTFREKQKVNGTYVEGLLARQVGSIIYPEFNVCGTVTGRISSKNPNLQNIPRDNSIRSFFVPRAGYVFVDADYSQLEVCIAAHFSQDKNLLSIIFDGASKHDITANSLGIERHLAKTLNFAMQYQCSSKKVQQILNCSKDDAELAWNKYWETYSGEKKVIDECKTRVDKGLPIITLFGRERHFPTRFSNKWEKEAAYRQAYSSLIQGTGADICNKAYYGVGTYLKRHNLGRALWPVHDEILSETKPDVVTQVIEKKRLIMTGIGIEIKLSIPLSVDAKGPWVEWAKA